MKGAIQHAYRGTRGIRFNSEEKLRAHKQPAERELNARVEASALGAAIITVVVEPSVSEALTLKGRRQAQKFSWARTAAETVAAYRQALG